MDRRVTPPQRVTLPTCGPLPLCKEAPNLSVHEILVVLFFSWPQGVLDLQDSFLEGDRKVSALFGHFIAAVGDMNIDGYQGNCGNIQTHRSEGNPGFFQGGVAPLTNGETDWSHKQILIQNTSCIRKPQLISWGKGVRTPLHPSPKSAPCSSPCTQLAKAFFFSHSEERSSARLARRGKAPSLVTDLIGPLRGDYS